MNLNIRATLNNTYDAIVIGSGISGGWAAKELCEKGLKTLVLERGRNVEHVKDYITTFKTPWEFKHGLANTEKDITEDPVQSTVYDAGNKHFFVRDQEHPYIQEKPFNWIRGYQVGGRSLTWGRQCYRLSDLDFEANRKDGHGVDWPIRYKDIAPWYDYVEQFAGISGQAEGLSQLPDGNFLPAMEMNCLETHFKDEVKKRFDGRCVTIGRVANLTKGWNGRTPCQFRNLCTRGCPYGGYFSSNAATLPAAMATGNLTLRPFSIVSEIMYDKDKKRAIGVRIIDTETKEVIEYFAKIIFLNASTIGSASLLLQSKSSAFPNGLGNSSDQVGRNLMDHHFKVGAMADYDGFHDQYYTGRRPVGIYVPRFRNLDAASHRQDYTRGYGFQAYAERENWVDSGLTEDGFGVSFKNKLTSPGKWAFWMGAWGETLPYSDNTVTLDPAQQDKWGIPLPKITFAIGDNEKAMRKDMQHSAMEMLDQSGFSNVRGFDYDYVGGDCVHEMGTARMGHDPKTSVLNAHNQLHEVQNVFVTDGSCMTSSACQNPSLTYMALTARACDYAVSELKKGNL
jgi:choline dehydrogenase-like flavoprotein